MIVYGVFSTDEQDGCTSLAAVFHSKELAEAHAVDCGGYDIQPIQVLMELPKSAVLFHAIYYSWNQPLGSSTQAWSYEEQYAELLTVPAPIYWENGRGDWTLTAYGKTQEEAQIALDNAVSARLNEKWQFADAGKWL